MKYLLIDSGFFIALYDERDKYHQNAVEFNCEYIENTNNSLMIPWPILYETFSTRMVRKRKNIKIFHRNLRFLMERKRIHFINDLPYREKALDDVFKELERKTEHYRDLSLVDRIVREILSASDLKIDIFKTYNHKDFYDICKRFRRLML
ncbi:MAG: hypothetical protein K8T10_05915 [Candidatus Eremiobacteraeota bacterium]|nr:hypothetical protein [Candidatus Eremiobacteraeota bacterium]